VAKRVVLIDDLDGSSGDETIIYRFDGMEWEIDLSTVNAKILREFLSTYMQASRPLNTPAKRFGTAAGVPHVRTMAESLSKVPVADRPGREYRMKVRGWAVANGKLSEQSRGRIAEAIYDEFHLANPQEIRRDPQTGEPW
jgi:hypothetical protein